MVGNKLFNVVGDAHGCTNVARAQGFMPIGYVRSIRGSDPHNLLLLLNFNRINSVYYVLEGLFHR